MQKLCLLVFAVLALTHCAAIREQINRNSYLATGRAPSGWTPKKSVCPAFARNGWHDHPAGPMCFKPPPKVGTKVEDGLRGRAVNQPIRTNLSRCCAGV
jgi:hypothetical protein